MNRRAAGAGAGAGEDEDEVVTEAVVSHVDMPTAMLETCIRVARSSMKV